MRLLGCWSLTLLLSWSSCGPRPGATPEGGQGRQLPSLGKPARPEASAAGPRLGLPLGSSSAQSELVAAAEPAEEAEAAAAGGASEPSLLYPWVWLDYWIIDELVPDETDYTEFEAPRPPLSNRRYLPIRLFGLKGATLASEGPTIAILRDGELQQDGLYSGHQPREKMIVGRFLGLAGAWPGRAFGLFEFRYETMSNSRQELELLKWDGQAWARLQVLRSKEALLAGNEAGMAVLVESSEERGKKGVRVRQVGGWEYRVTRASSGCLTELVEPSRVEVSQNGTVLVEGRQCGSPEQRVLELWRSPSQRSVLLKPPLHSWQTSVLDQSGRVWVAGSRGAGGRAAILRLEAEGGWVEQEGVEAEQVESLAVEADGRVWVVARNQAGEAELLRSGGGAGWERLRLPGEAGRVERVEVVGGRVWVSALRAVLSTEPPRNVWDWEAQEVAAYPLSHARRGVRSRVFLHCGYLIHCPGRLYSGGALVLVYDRSKQPDWEKWAKIFQDNRGPGTPRIYPWPKGSDSRFYPSWGLIPVVAREADTYWFGFIAGSDCTAYKEAWRRPPNPKPPALYCANPLSLSMRRIIELFRPWLPDGDQISVATPAQ